MTNEEMMLLVKEAKAVLQESGAQFDASIKEARAIQARILKEL